ncbi:MAG: serine hydrolase [Saprospiraceae bacterium]|nr:serine hydrolase [Saprospiraceae bacterium]
MRILMFLLTLNCCFLSSVQAQDSYFPPIDEDEWESVDPSTLGWCAEKVDALSSFLEEKNTKSFLILKGGKIVMEAYYGEHDAEKVWYWASASKSLVATLYGMAQEDGLLDINDPTSDYLGEGWTSATPEQEAAISLKSQLSMASGLDDGVETTGSTDNCFEPQCFQYLSAPYSRWAYHNSAYRILQDVLETASGQTKFNYTRGRLGDRIGMKGFWLNYVYYSTGRDMARFGLLALHRGIWGTDTLLQEQAYFDAMIQPSQAENPSYGYLWWLNGQEAFQLPGVQFKINRAMIPEAPADLFAALGKNDQKIYVVPSEDLVVVRQGDAAGGVVLSSSSFDAELWQRLGDMNCTVSTTDEQQKEIFVVSPNPVVDELRIQSASPVESIRLYDLRGRTLLAQMDTAAQLTLSIARFPKGTYFLQVKTKEGVGIKRIVKS